MFDALCVPVPTVQEIYAGCFLFALVQLYQIPREIGLPAPQIRGAGSGEVTWLLRPAPGMGHGAGVRKQVAPISISVAHSATFFFIFALCSQTSLGIQIYVGQPPPQKLVGLILWPEC